MAQNTYSICSMLNFAQFWVLFNVQAHSIFKFLHFSRLLNFQAYSKFKFVQFWILLNFQAYSIFKFLQFPSWKKTKTSHTTQNQLLLWRVEKHRILPKLSCCCQTSKNIAYYLKSAAAAKSRRMEGVQRFFWWQLAPGPSILLPHQHTTQKRRPKNKCFGKKKAQAWRVVYSSSVVVWK